MSFLDEIVTPDEQLISLAASGAAARGLESTAGSPSKETMVEMVKARLAGAANREIASQIVLGAERVLEKAGDPAATYTRRDLAGLEAVVLTRNRPSLTVRDDGVSQYEPGARHWEQRLLGFQDAMRTVITAIGRINVPTEIGFAGTAILIADGVVVTNRHVLEQIARRQAIDSWVLRAPNETRIDFVAEAGRASEARFLVKRARFWGPDEIDDKLRASNLDLAILDIDPIGDAPWPKPVRFCNDPTWLDVKRNVYTIGFPGKPSLWEGEGTPLYGTEIEAVLKEAFDSKFGCKKLAPGQVMQLPGTLVADNLTKWVFTHDSSTLRGNSGSAVVDFDQDGASVLGLHIGGVSRSRNYAHSFSAPVVKQIMIDNGATYCAV